MKDAVFALRALRKSPGFAAVAIVSLALGIGANSAIFTLVNAVFLQPIPVKDPSRLVTIDTTDPKNPGFLGVSRPNYLDYRDKNSVFSSVLGSFGCGMAFGTRAEPEQIFGELVSANYFDTLGVKPALGRTFLPEEDGAPDSGPVVVLSNTFWTRRFGASPAALGQKLTLNGATFTIIGVAPAGFRGLNALRGPELWAPLSMYRELSTAPQYFDERRFLWLTAVGRLKPGVTMTQAQAEVQTIAKQLEQAYP